MQIQIGTIIHRDKKTKAIQNVLPIKVEETQQLKESAKKLANKLCELLNN